MPIKPGAISHTSSAVQEYFFKIFSGENALGINFAATCHARESTAYLGELFTATHPHSL